MRSHEPLEWAVVGGGLHGCHFAVCLLRLGLDPTRLKVFDRHSEPIAQWSSWTGRLQMRSLRSAGVHHLDLSPWSYFHHSKKRYRRDDQWHSHPYRRPKYEAFQQHCQTVFAQVRLSQAFQQAEVEHLSRVSPGAGSGYRIHTDRGVYVAKRVLLAPGQPPLEYPAWAHHAPNSGIRHVFAGRLTADIDLDDPRAPSGVGGGPPGFGGALGEFDGDGGAPGFGGALGEFGGGEDAGVVVLGGGITAASLALALEKRRRVTLLHRGPLRVHDFDSDPCWLGPRCLNRSFQSASPEEKRERIAAARHRGSMNREVFNLLQAAVKQQRLHTLQGEVLGVDRRTLLLTSGESLPFERLLLATGFQSVRPGGALVDRAVDELRLPLAPCGFPLLQNGLEWAPRLYVSGGLAELCLGPAARNIAGARMVAKRILALKDGAHKRRPFSLHP